MGMEITMPRGDIRPVRFLIKGENGDPASVLFTEIYVTFKKSFIDKTYLFQKRLSDGTVLQLDVGDYEFIIMPEDTDGLKITDYVFDIEVLYEDQIKQTFVGKLILTNEVTFAENEGETE